MLASLVLAACGGSSSSSPRPTASASASTATPSTGASAQARGRHGRFAALRECLQKNGITLPKRTPGKRPTPGGRAASSAAAAAGSYPKGVTRAQYEAALKKCGGSAARLRRAGGARRFSSPAAKKALAKFATCMRENGVNVPAPNTSGKGPIFNTKGLDTNSAKFKAAEPKCQHRPAGRLRRRRARPGAPPTAARRRAASGLSSRRRPDPSARYGRFGSGTAAELGLVAIVGVGSAATRSISWFHCAALRALVVTSGEGAVRPVRAECAAVAVAAGLSASVAAGGRNSRWMWFQSAAEACVLGDARVAHQADDLVRHELRWAASAACGSSGR